MATYTDFSRREMAIIRCLANGASQKEIARALGMTPKTVMHAIAAAKRRAKAKTMAQLVALAVERSGTAWQILKAL